MHQASAARGFTLIEVLIAMTLLSVMVVLLFASLNVCAESWDRGDKKMVEVNEAAVVHHFFQQHLTAAKPLWNLLSAAKQSQGEQPTFSFQGTSESLQFVGDFPASAARGGLQLFLLELQNNKDEPNSPDGADINIILNPFFPLTEGEQLQKEEITLLKRIKHLALSYYGIDNNGEDRWQGDWQDRTSLPQLVKIRIERDNGIFWPDMIIELKVIGTGDDSDTGDIEGAVDNEPGAEDADDPVDNDNGEANE
jgi:general secretion pathway protein J